MKKKKKEAYRTLKLWAFKTSGVPNGRSLHCCMHKLQRSCVGLTKIEICRRKYGTFRVLLGKKLATNRFITEVPNDAMLASVDGGDPGSITGCSWLIGRSKDSPVSAEGHAFTLLQHRQERFSGEGMEVTLGLNVREIISKFGKYVTPSLPSADEESTSTDAERPQRNAFVLLAASTQAVAAPSHLPEANRTKRACTSS